MVPQPPPSLPTSVPQPTSDSTSDSIHLLRFSQHSIHHADHIDPIPPDHLDPSQPSTAPTNHALSNQSWQGSNILNSCLQPGSLRMTFQNIRGLRAATSTIQDSLHDVYATMLHYDIAFLGISEHHLATNNPSTDIQLRQAQSNIAPHSHLHCQFNASHQPPPPNSDRLMGGTAIINRPPMIGRLSPHNQRGDEMGRWTISRYRRHNQPDLVIISIYQVCKPSTNTTGYTAWHQQRLALDATNRETQHPRQAFLHDLKHTINSFKLQSCDIIVGGDWNDHLDSQHSSLLNLCSSHELIDPWVHHHPHHKNFGTHERGQHRIDSVLISPRLLPAIQTISYSPIGLLFNTDHRCIIIEWSTSKLFGNPDPIPPTRLPRALRSKDHQAVTNFIEATHAHLTHNNAFDRMSILDNLSNLDSSATSLVENLDAILADAIQAGERKCQHRRREWYSQAIVQTRLEVSYLKHYLNELQHDIDRTLSTQTKLITIGSPIQLPMDIPTTTQTLEARIQQLKQHKKNSFQLRQHSLTPTVPSSKQDPRAKIRKAETAARTWKTLKTLTSTDTNQTLNRIDIPHDWPPPLTSSSEVIGLSDPKTATQWTTISDPKHIEYYLLLRNRLHFGQAHGTPFTVEPLQSQINWGATTPSSDDILSDQFVTDTHLDNLTISVIRQCRRSAPGDLTPPLLSADEFKGKIKVWNEATTTSPSGRHLGVYKSLYSRGVYFPLSSEDALRLQSQQEDIRTLMLSIINYCIRTGHVLTRWKQITNVMIFKEVGNYKIHKLRIIHIYEADLNLLMAVKWRNVLHAADTSNIINPNQYGGRPGHEATYPVLLEELKLDISYLSRRSLATFDNDAASCYDRIIPAFASLVNRKYGLPTPLTRLHGNLLQEANYRLLTANGLSDLSYSHSPLYPIYGSGQGSGNSPVLWLFISATLFDVHEQSTTGATFTSPDGSQRTSITITGFVDDTNASLNSWLPQQPTSTPLLLKQLEKDAQRWNDLLFISGGKLELSKCSYHLLEFTFQPDGTPKITTTIHPPISIRDSVTQDLIQISALSSLTPHKTLGHWKAPAGNSRTQLLTIQHQTRTISHLIATAPIPRYGTKRAYHGKYVASLRYILPQCHFDHQLLRQAEKPSMSLLIRKSGFSSKTSQALLYTPTTMGGGGFIHWDHIQSTGQIKNLLKHWRASHTQPSSLLRIGVAWAQWQAGISQPIFQFPTIPLEYLEARWLKSVRFALQSANASLRLAQSCVPKPERIKDRYIMDVARDSCSFSPKDLRILNYCRLYLHVTTISELYNAKCTDLSPFVLKGHRPPWFNPHMILTIQARPSDYHWTHVWRKLCTIIESTHFRLGRWRQKSFPLRLRRETYLHQGVIYHWYAGSYWSCQSAASIHRYQLHQREEEWTPTALSLPVDIIARVHNTIYLEPTQQFFRPPASIAIPASFEEYIRTRPPYIQSLLQHIQWYYPPFSALSLLSKCTPEHPLLIVSDGSSFESQSMSYGTVISTSQGQILVECRGPATGPISSHRAECTGALAGGYLLQELFNFTYCPVPPSFGAKAISDNKGMIHSLTRRWAYSTSYTNATLKPDWDLLKEITITYKKIHPHAFQFSWVKGHQDNQKDLDELPLEARLNIRADELAGQFAAENMFPHNPQTQLFPSTHGTLDIGSNSIQGNYSQSLYQSMSAPLYHSYLQRKHSWSSTTLSEVDWASLAMASRNYFSSEVHLLKLIHDCLPTRLHVSRFQSWIPPHCHYCDQPESFSHLLTCPCHPLTASLHAQTRQKLTDYMNRHQTPLRFQEIFLHAVHQACSSSPAPALLRHAEISQAHIGWHLILRGFLSIKWRSLLQQTQREEANAALITHSQPVKSPANPYAPSTVATDILQPTTPQSFLAQMARLATNKSLSRKLVRTSNTPSHNPRCTDPTIFFSGLIKIFWSEAGQFWLDHLAGIHKLPPPGPPPRTPSPNPFTPATAQSQETQANLRTHAIFLQRLKPYVPSPQRKQYFPTDATNFITGATSNRLQQYLATYKPAIISSIRKVLPTLNDEGPSLRQILSDAFTWKPQDRRPLQIIHDICDTIRPSHPATEEASHRKRNRLRRVPPPNAGAPSVSSSPQPPP